MSARRGKLKKLRSKLTSGNLTMASTDTTPGVPNVPGETLPTDVNFYFFLFW